ncbi:MAG: DNA-directed RNA polymerase subunit omega [Proteobacteria bacterium]|nr:DNA-directed RNA polymerase subunit omega [Pseudomonadota bacterium]
MARVTVEDCLEKENNRFSLVRLASRRAKQLLAGHQPVTDTKGNRAVVSALREIADGRIKFKKAEKVTAEYTNGADEEKSQHH